MQQYPAVRDARSVSRAAPYQHKEWSTYDMEIHGRSVNGCRTSRRLVTGDLA